MKLLLDTCASLWLAESPGQLSPKARQMILENPAPLFVSAISAFEVGVKHRKGKLDLKHPPEQWWKLATSHHGVTVLPVTDELALASTALPLIHHDPCDRLIVATAEDIAATILTRIISSRSIRRRRWNGDALAEAQLRRQVRAGTLPAWTKPHSNKRANGCASGKKPGRSLSKSRRRNCAR